MSAFKLPLPRQQEEFSIAFVHAVASTAGFSIEEIRVDVDSVDLTIMQFGTDDDFPFFDSLRVQLKCTYAHRPHGGHFPFPLSVKNYNDLRRRTAYPRILVVVHIPENVDNWLEQSEDSLALYHCGYWISLRDMPATSNTKSVTVNILTAQRFTVAQLQEIMRLIAEGERL